MDLTTNGKDREGVTWIGCVKKYHETHRVNK